MATFYKYKEREDITKSMIDWSGLTKEISDNLIKEKNRRDKLKFELEQDHLEKLKAIDEYSKGLDPTMNQAMVKIADNYRKYLLLNHKHMKNGLISVSDTKIRKQGAMDTFNAINDVTKTYNEKMSAFIEKGGNVNEFIASNTARALDISKSQLVIDDMGRGTFVTTDENGNEVVMPATAFNTVLNDQYERFDTASEVKSVVNGLATWTLTSKGGYKSVSDFRQKDGENYKKTIMSKVDSILNNDKTIVSAAADMLDMRPTTDKELAKSNPEKYFLAEYKNGKIVFDVDGVKEKVREGLYNNIDASVDRIEKETPRRIPTDKGNKFNRDATSLYNLSTRAARGESVAFDQIEGRLYSVTDEEGNKKSVKLSRPTLTDDGNILITDANGREVLNIPSGPDAALAIANIIRSGESADTVQSLFEQGERISGGKLPPLRSDIEEKAKLVSALSDMPVEETAAVKWLESNLPSDIDVDEAVGGYDYVKLTKGQDSENFATTDIDGIKAWLDKYDATPMTTESKTTSKKPNLNASNRKE